MINATLSSPYANKTVKSRTMDEFSRELVLALREDPHLTVTIEAQDWHDADSGQMFVIVDKMNGSIHEYKTPDMDDAVEMLKTYWANGSEEVGWKNKIVRITLE